MPRYRISDERCHEITLQADSVNGAVKAGIKFLMRVEALSGWLVIMESESGEHATALYKACGQTFQYSASIRKAWAKGAW